MRRYGLEPTTNNLGVAHENGDIEQARHRFKQAADQALPCLYDPGTICHLQTLGVRTGWCCLELGAGGCSVARWLVERAGQRARAGDRHRHAPPGAPAGPSLAGRRHDIIADPLPEGACDLAPTRLALALLPEREAALARGDTVPKPGGWLLVREFDSLNPPPVP